MTETIFALATARGKSGVAVVRVSGPKALEAAASLGVTGLQPRRAILRKLKVQGEVLDEGLVLYFPKPASFTGEDVVEFQVHGSTAVLSALLRVLGDVDGLRSALPGEFTRRALENGMLDLTQVEGLADLIDAETESQRRQALRVMSGRIGDRVKEWRKSLLRAAALIEATIDFADEDVPSDVTPEVLELLVSLTAALDKEIEGSHIAERIRDGFEVAIIGAPNAGKSSLINALAGREAAITSHLPGTTRDIIEVRLDLGGLAVTVLDTAGLREATDEIEKIGIERAKARAALADLRVLLVAPDGPTASFELEPDDLVVETKADLVPRSGAVSSVSGEGLDHLIERIRCVLEARSGGAGLLTRARHREAVISARESLSLAIERLHSDHPALELVAAELRSAIRSLEVLVGKIGVETMLGEIFSSFCIGK